ncbi:MAG: NlpC/P60 family protein [Thermomicrobiales bacterium]
MTLAQSPASVVSDTHVPNIHEQLSDHAGGSLLGRRISRRSAVAMLFGTGLTLAAGSRMAAAQEDATAAESGTNQDPPTDESVSAPGDSASGNGQAIADYTMQFLGDAYVYAGNQPGGFDCSGFTEYVVLNTVDIDIGHGGADGIRLPS